MTTEQKSQIKIILSGIGVGLVIGVITLLLIKKPWIKSETHPAGCTEKTEIVGACPEED